MRALALLLALATAPVSAQVVYPPVAIDLSAVPSKADVQAAADAATAAQNAATAAQTAAAAKCAPMAAVPPAEVIGGAAGSGSNCRLANSVQPRITRSVAFTTTSNGQAVVTWTDMGAVPLVFPVANVVSTATNVPSCYPVIGTITSTGATIRCYMTQSLLGLGLLPFTVAPAGVTGQILAIPAS